jgi:hypothetical protein
LAQNNFEIDAPAPPTRSPGLQTDIDIPADQSLNQVVPRLDQHHVCCQTVFFKEASLLRHPRVAVSFESIE